MEALSVLLLNNVAMSQLLRFIKKCHYMFLATTFNIPNAKRLKGNCYITAGHALVA